MSEASFRRRKQAGAMSPRVNNMEWVVDKVTGFFLKILPAAGEAGPFSDGAIGE